MKRFEVHELFVWPLPPPPPPEVLERGEGRGGLGPQSLCTKKGPIRFSQR